jgi:hypothetical protein
MRRRFNRRRIATASPYTHDERRLEKSTILAIDFEVLQNVHTHQNPPPAGRSLQTVVDRGRAELD